MTEVFVVEKMIDTIVTVDTIAHAIDGHYYINIFFICTFRTMIHNNTPNIEGYLKLKYICGIALPFGIVKKSVVYILIQ